MNTFKIAIFQFRATMDPVRNLQFMEAALAEASSLQASVFCGPEMFYRYGESKKVRDAALSLEGPEVQELGSLAKKYKIWFFPGSVAQKTTEGVVNTALFFDPEGRLVSTYQKRHLFSADILGKIRHNEALNYIPGMKEPALIRTEHALFGPSICYDLRFSEQYLTLALQGAEVFLVPAAFTKVTGEAHWEILCRARAIENTCFVVAPNQVGHTKPAFENYGHSLVVDPWGEVLLDAGEKEGVFVCTLESSRLVEARRRIPVLGGRKS